MILSLQLISYDILSSICYLWCLMINCFHRMKCSSCNHLIYPNQLWLCKILFYNQLQNCGTYLPILFWSYVYLFAVVITWYLLFHNPIFMMAHRVTYGILYSYGIAILGYHMILLWLNTNILCIRFNTTNEIFLSILILLSNCI